MGIFFICYHYVMSLEKCYLIGGAPLSGKSTLADTIAAKHQAVQISTDNIREWMKKVSSTKEYPDLFYDKNMDVESFYKHFDTPEIVMNAEINQGKEVEKGIKALLECYLPWERLVIEGIAITPASAKKLAELFPKIEFEIRFLYDDNVERIKQRVWQRGLWDLADKYPDYIKEKEVQWVVLYNEFYMREAEEYKYLLDHIDTLIV
jgi:2-phosphoglycerate kinase